ncbi:hypothetical protein ACFLZV_01075 [Candidatus Margulisiibacteriota bacterium]
MIKIIITNQIIVVNDKLGYYGLLREVALKLILFPGCEVRSASKD